MGGTVGRALRSSTPGFARLRYGGVAIKGKEVGVVDSSGRLFFRGLPRRAINALLVSDSAVHLTAVV